MFCIGCSCTVIPEFIWYFFDILVSFVILKDRYSMITYFKKKIAIKIYITEKRVAVKIAYGHKIARKHFARGIKLHKETFPRKVTYTQRLICLSRQFCIEIILHGLIFFYSFLLILFISISSFLLFLLLFLDIFD